MHAAGHACGRPFVKPPDSSAARVLRDVFYELSAAAGRGGRPKARGRHGARLFLDEL